MVSTASSCTAPDPAVYPTSWVGNLNDYSCTADETAHFDLTTFSYSCKAVNCQAKYGSDSAVVFDTECRVCVQCSESEADSESACESTFDIDASSAGLTDFVDDGSCQVGIQYE